jgi:hypothetical protein
MNPEECNEGKAGADTVQHRVRLLLFVLSVADERVHVLVIIGCIVSWKPHVFILDSSVSFKKAHFDNMVLFMSPSWKVEIL